MSRTYGITADNVVHLVEAGYEQVEGAFATADEFAELVADWPLRRLVEVWNKLPGVRPLSRFENRGVAVQRIWRALHREHQPAPALRAARQRRARRTKTQVVLQLLCQPEGATLPALMKATHWQAHSVRGFLSRKVAGSLGLPLQSTKRDGQRVYSLPSETALTGH